VTLCSIADIPARATNRFWRPIRILMAGWRVEPRCGLCSQDCPITRFKACFANTQTGQLRLKQARGRPADSVADTSKGGGKPSWFRAEIHLLVASEAIFYLVGRWASVGRDLEPHLGQAMREVTTINPFVIFARIMQKTQIWMGD
jgi:hypothetical protein